MLWERFRFAILTLAFLAALPAGAADLTLTVPPAACFTGGAAISVTAPAGAAITFTAAPADSTSITPTTRYFWEFGDGTPIQGGIAKQVQHTYTQVGRFPVRLRVANGAKTHEIVGEVLVQGTCEQYRSQKGAWEVACNDRTAAGYYWQVGPEIEEYGWWGVVPSGVRPPCNETAVGQTAMTYAWQAQPTWEPVNTTWCRNHQDDSNQGCGKGQGPVYNCTAPHCGIHRVTCRRQ